MFFRYDPVNIGAIMNSQGAKAVVRDTRGQITRRHPRGKLIALVAIMLTHHLRHFPGSLLVHLRFCQVFICVRIALGTSNDVFFFRLLLLLLLSYFVVRVEIKKKNKKRVMLKGCLRYYIICRRTCYLVCFLPLYVVIAFIYYFPFEI